MGITMGTCKTISTRADLSISTDILKYSGILRHNRAYPGIVQAYSGIIRTLCNPGIFRNLTYSEPEAYSEPYQTFMMERFMQIANVYNYFRKL